MASSYGHIKKGAQGDTVKWLQQQLGIEADGIFGSQTEKAVRDFQSANNIRVDGIVGNETIEYLLKNGGGNGYTTPNNATTDYLSGYSSVRPTYSPSQAVTDAANLLAQYEGNRPAAYQSSYAAQIQGMLDQIMNREKFSYDFATDPMYQQYADKYQQQGKMAMMDTMGQAAALTGGYGNSYAQNVGQQAYQAHLQNLNDIIPELRDAAYQMYQDEGQQMYNQMSLLQGLEDTEYGRYRDTVGDWQTDRGYYYNKYNDLNEFDYGKYLDDASMWQDDRDFAYRQQQDAQDQANWEAEFAFTKQQANKSSSSGGSRSGSSSRSSGSGTEAYSDVKMYLDEQYASGATPDELQVLLYGVDNISDDDFEKLQTYIDLLGMSGGVASSTPAAPKSIPTTYKEYADATGDSGIMTESEFRRRKGAGQSSLAQYSNYQEYLADKYKSRK